MHSKITLLLITILFCTNGGCAEKGFFWHMTGLHYGPTNCTPQPSASCFQKLRRPGRPGERACRASWRFVKHAVKAMADIKPDVDFILWTGDSSVSPLNVRDASPVANSNNMDIMENVTKLLRESFSSSVRIFPLIGIHDVYASRSNQADVVKVDVEEHSRMSELWNRWIDDQEQLTRLVSGRFYHSLIRPGLRLLALNTNLYRSQNRITQWMTDPAGQFKWMGRVLEQARSKGEKVLVAGTIPPGVNMPAMISLMHPQQEIQLVKILTTYSDVIVSSHYGHAHADDGFKVIQHNQKVKNAIPQFIAPSLTPFQTGNSEKSPGCPSNPGIRLVVYERDTGKHINYIQYFLDLTESNKNNNSVWAPLYSFTQAYGANDMSVESLKDIFSRMKKDELGEVFAQRYCNYNVVSGRDVPCPPRSRWAIICAGHFYRQYEAMKCMERLMNVGKTKAVPRWSSVWKKYDDRIVTQSICLVVIIIVCYVSCFVVCHSASEKILHKTPTYRTI